MLDAAAAAGQEHFVVVFHSFSAVKPKDVEWKEMRPNRMVIRRLEGLFQYLADNPDRFRVSTMGKAAEELSTRPLKPATLPPVVIADSDCCRPSRCVRRCSSSTAYIGLDGKRLRSKKAAELLKSTLVNPAESERHVVIHRKGKKPPLFWVQPGIVQTPVLQELDRDQPVHFLYRLQSEAGQRSLTFSEIAAYHIETLRSVSPRGPYALAGFCVCGTIAHAMACQLHAQGETVSTLIMIDPVDAAVSHGQFVQEPALFKLGFNFHRVIYHLAKVKDYSLADKVAYFKKSLRAIKGRRALHTRQHVDSQMAQSAVDVHASDMHGFTHCVPEPYPGQAILLRPGKSPRNAYKYPNLRWRQLITGGVEIQKVPGDSDTMWVAPHAQGMARTIEGLSARAREYGWPDTRSRRDERPV